MGRLPRNGATAFLAWWILRRRLRRSGHVLAPVGVVGLEMVGPRVFLIRRTLVIAVALTVVGLLALALGWWVLRSRRGGDDGEGWDEPGPEPEPPTTDVQEPETALAGA